MNKIALHAAIATALIAPAVVLGAGAASAQPTVIVAEGEFFTPQPGAKAGQEWKLTPQDQSHASHSYGGMWSMNGALIGAPADSADAVATRKITVPAAGAYRVWSKYQAPPYFNYLHKIEIVQNGQTVYSQVYGKVDSPRMKLLFDIYHVQIMDGDVIRRIRQYKDYIAHVHTAGVPGRVELTEDQELYYPAVMRALIEVGYTGFVAQEFIPTWPDKVAALRYSVRVCDV